MKRLLVCLTFIFLTFPFSVFGQWSSVGSGFSGGDPNLWWLGGRSTDVQGMIVFQNDLYVWGDFDSVDGFPAHNFARYDGSQWYSLPFTGIAYDMEVFKGELYIAGYTGLTGPLPQRHITKWDGVNWMALDTNIVHVFEVYEDGIHDLQVYKGHLYLAGQEIRIVSPTTNIPIFNQYPSLIRWDGNSWDSIPNITPTFSVYNGSLSIFNDQLLVTATQPMWFTSSNISHSYFFDSLNWSMVPSSWQNSFSIYARGNGVQVGSKFFRSHNVVSEINNEIPFQLSSFWPSNKLLSYNNRVISIYQDSIIQVSDTLLKKAYLLPFGSSQLHRFEALAIYRDTLYVGGNFVEIDAQTMNGIMKWEGNIDSTILSSIQDNPSLLNKVKIFPNPANNSLIVQSSKIMEHIEIKDLTGTTLYQKVENSFETKIDLSEIPNGLYLISTVSQSGIMQTQKVIIQH